MTQVKNNTTEPSGDKSPPAKPGGFSQFLTLRVIAGIALGVVALWACGQLLGLFEGTESLHVVDRHVSEPSHGGEAAEKGAPHVADEPISSDHFPLDDDFPLDDETSSEHEALPEHEVSPSVSPDHMASPDQALLHGPDVRPEPKALGVHLVEATIGVLDYELNERFLGWRRNDLIRFTDNVENMQLGVLEVVRRTSVNLMERISRHGVSASIDKNLEDAMNWLMIKPSKFWLPSAEDKYNASLKELRLYAQKLERGEAHFYVRTDSLIPLLLALADLAGSSDENLVKAEEDDGSPVSWFMCDDYFYYAKGVAKAMAPILHAVREDFSSVLEARHGVDLLNYAIHACHVAAELDPWLVTDAPLDGILANHRANMAAEMSHVRYFLDALSKAMST